MLGTIIGTPRDTRVSLVDHLLKIIELHKLVK